MNTTAPAERPPQRPPSHSPRLLPHPPRRPGRADPPPAARRRPVLGARRRRPRLVRHPRLDCWLPTRVHVENTENIAACSPAAHGSLYGLRGIPHQGPACLVALLPERPRRLAPIGHQLPPALLRGTRRDISDSGVTSSQFSLKLISSRIVSIARVPRTAVTPGCSQGLTTRMGTSGSRMKYLSSSMRKLKVKPRISLTNFPPTVKSSGCFTISPLLGSMPTFSASSQAIIVSGDPVSTKKV